MIEDIIKANIKGLKIVIKGRDDDKWEIFGSNDYEWSFNGGRDFYSGRLNALQRLLEEIK